MEDHIKEKEKEKEWGNYWLRYKIEVYTNQNLTAKFTYVENEPDYYYNEVGIE